jgi:hypothetical protein
MGAGDSGKSGDMYIEKRLARYDRWVQEGRDPFSSKVVPVGESLATQQRLVPAEQVIEFLRNARSFALVGCECRTRHQRCDNPVDICFLINDAADACLAQAIGRPVSPKDAAARLHQANERIWTRVSAAGIVSNGVYLSPARGRMSG